MTTQFYAPPSSFRHQRLILDGDEAKHIARSLRKEPGDVIWVVDGKGHRHEVELNHVRPKQVVGTVQSTEHNAGEPPYRLTLSLGLLKNRNRFETFLEKAVECGVSRIIPLQTERTHVESLREKRAENILVAAMKQSGRSVLPDLNKPTELPAVLAETAPDRTWICHESAAAPPLPEAVRQFRDESSDESATPAELLVLVGPEGGFSDAEVQDASDAGAHPVRLGPHRLRAETAGIVAASAISLAYADASPSDATSFL